LIKQCFSEIIILEMKLYKILTGLITLVFVSAVGFFIVYPLIPKYIEVRNEIGDVLPYEIGFQSTMQFLVKLTEPAYEEDDEENTVEYVPDNIEVANLEQKNTTLSIPTISVNGKVVDGQSQYSMFRGFWHHPLSSEPGQRGSTVIFGHRFDKLPPSSLTFFNLDKVDAGDKVFVSQNGRKFEYTVVKVYETEKNDARIFSNITDYQLTLVTCTPLWTSEKRLVVIAVQDWVSSVI